MKPLLLLMLSILLTAGIPMDRIEDAAATGDKAAINALRDSAAAGNTRAMNYLGFLYWQGNGTILDRDSAVYFLELAAEKGDLKANANLGHLLLTGSPELKADTSRGLTLIHKAALRGLPPAIRELADYYDHEEGDSAGASFIKTVADAYSHGRVLHYDYKKSIKMYYRAATLGDTVSKRIIRELVEIFPDALRSL